MCARAVPAVTITITYSNQASSPQLQQFSRLQLGPFTVVIAIGQGILVYSVYSDLCWRVTLGVFGLLIYLLSVYPVHQLLIEVKEEVRERRGEK